MSDDSPTLIPSEAPEFPDLVVQISDQDGKPMTVIALVRRALQKAGHSAAAMRFTEAAMACEPDELVTTIQRFVVTR